MAERCVCCGEIIPEGQQVCPLCQQVEKRTGNYHHNGNPKHGLYHGNESLFNTWQTMIGRCENPYRPKYKDYGGRGIKVCPEWKTAQNFVRWALGNGYQPGLQIDRIDNDGDYCPENCRFVTPKENSRNRRNTKFLTLDGATKCVSEWAEITGICKYTIYDWYRKYGRVCTEYKVLEAWNRRAEDGK